MTHQILELFPTPIYRALAESLLPHLDDVEKEIDALKETDIKRFAGTDLEKVLQWEQYTTFFSNQRLHMLTWFEPVEKAILHHVNIFKDALSMDLGSRKLKIETSFANIMDKPYHHHGRHIHHGSIFSGVIYIKAGKGAGQITFEHPANDHFMNDFKYKDRTILNSSTVSISPNSGEIVIFLSHTPHQVEQSYSDTKRVAISFNAVLD